MSRKLPTIVILLVMALVGVMYWVDLRYYTDPATGFVLVGSVWVRYAVLLLPLVMGLLGLQTVSVRAMATLRVQNKPLAVLFALAGLSGLAYGGVCLWQGAKPFALWQVLLGAMFLWYGVWMGLAALQMQRQQNPSPTKSAVPGLLAALPFCALAVYRVLVRPTTLYRVGPFVKNFSALFAMLWLGVLLRALYIALVKTRVRWLYGFGIFSFLLATCLEMPQAIYTALYGSFDLTALLEGVAMGCLGLVAGGVSVAISAQELPRPKPAQEQ